MTLGLAEGSRITLVCLGVRKQQAQSVVFDQIGTKIQMSPWFLAQRPKFTKKEIIFPKDIVITGGESTDMSFIGQDVLGGIIDEANFMTPEGGLSRGARNIDRAESIYDHLIGRMKSRYMKEGGRRGGLLFLISSKRAEADFVERRLKDAIEEPLVFVRDYAQWDTIARLSKEDTFRVLVGTDSSSSKVLDDNDVIPDDSNLRIINVPISFRKDFIKDIETSLRNYAGISTSAVYPFFRLREKLAAMEDPSIPSPFYDEEVIADMPVRYALDRVFDINERGERVPKCCPHAVRAVHVDLGHTECPAAISMGHIHAWFTRTRETEEGKVISEDIPLMHVDFVLRIKAPDGGEIIFEYLRDIVYTLSEAGYPISTVTMDSWQSTYLLQMFRRSGFSTGLISTESIEPFIVARPCIYEGRVKCAPNALLLEELRKLEYNAAKRKVVRRHDSWKDMADAFCGVLYSLSGKPVQPTSFISTSNVMAERKIEFRGGAAFIPGGQIIFEDEYEDAKGISTDMPFLLG